MTMTAAVSNTENYYTSSASEAASTASSSDNSYVKHDEFLKLLTTQLTNQDPLNPMDNTAFLSQMAQLQALDEQIDTNNNLAQLSQDSQMQGAANLVGKKITGEDDYGSEASGTVINAMLKDDTVYIQLDNLQKLKYENVTNVENIEATTNDATMESLLRWLTYDNRLGAASGMIGNYVFGEDTNGNDVEGLVLNASVQNGNVLLQLPNEVYVPFEKVTDVTVAFSSDTEATEGE